MENQIFELQYAMDTFYFLVCGALVMWMAAGFAMLEAGLVRAKNTTEILTKNVALFAISCIMYLVCGYAIMYGGGIFLDGIEAFDLAGVLSASDTRYESRGARSEERGARSEERGARSESRGAKTWLSRTQGFAFVTRSSYLVTPNRPFSPCKGSAPLF